MSASVTEKTKRGPIQFQKFQRFFRGQPPRRFARTSGRRDQPDRGGIQPAVRVAEIDRRGDLGLVVHGAPPLAPDARADDRQVVGEQAWH